MAVWIILQQMHLVMSMKERILLIMVKLMGILQPVLKMVEMEVAEASIMKATLNFIIIVKFVIIKQELQEAVF